MKFPKLTTGVLSLALLASTLTPLVASAGAPEYGPQSDFYIPNRTPAQLANMQPGHWIRYRSFNYYGVWFQNITATQILHKSSNVLGGQTSTNMVTVLRPTNATNITKVMVNGIAYDSLNPMDEPSVTIQKQQSVSSTENISSYLSQGYAVILPDTEGQTANMTAGREYGMNTLDAIRAAFNVPDQTKINPNAKVVLAGYSGGAWSSMWAAQMAPTYAPDVNAKLVGVAVGGLPVNAAHISQYLSGSALFSGEIPTSIIGMARAYNVDFRPYLNAKGVQMYNDLQNASLGSVIGKYWGLKLSDILKPEYQNPNSIPDYVRIVNDNNLGSLPAPTIPVYIVQGDAPWGALGTNNHPVYGTGDGATVTKDVRSLASQFCSTARKVYYTELSWSDHLFAAISSQYTTGSANWIKDRMDGKVMQENCDLIKPGNSLAPEVIVNQ